MILMTISHFFRLPFANLPKRRRRTLVPAGAPRRCAGAGRAQSSPAIWAASKRNGSDRGAMTEFDVKQLRPNLTPAQVFWRFFLLGPIFGALVQLFLLNVLLLII